MKTVLLLLLAGIGCHAQWTNNAAQNTAVTSHSFAYEPKMVSDGSGGVFMVWLDMRNGQDFDIYAQKIDAQGVAAWTPNGIIVTDSPGNQIYDVESEEVNVASDGQGGFVVTWINEVIPDEAYQLFAQRISGSGTKLWGENGVLVRDVIDSEDGVDGASPPNICATTDNGAIITWMDLRTGPLGYTIYAQKINSAGVAVWAEDGVKVSGDFIAALPKIVADSNGGAIISWIDLHIPDPDLDVYSQRISSTGTKMWEDDGVPIFTLENEENHDVGMIQDGFGGAIIAWSETRNGNYGVYAQRISESGEVIWQVDGLKVSDTTNDQYFEKFVSDGSGGAIFTWVDERNDSSGDIYAQRINNAGMPVWAEDGVVVCNFGESVTQFLPFLTTDQMGGAVIAWEDTRNHLITDGDTYAQRIDGGGNVIWNPDGIIVCNNPEWQTTAYLIPTNNNGVIAGWWDTRYATEDENGDIFVQNICANGQLGDCNLSNEEFLQDTVVLHPNPTKSSVFFDNFKAKFTKVSVYNSLGQNIWHTDLQPLENQEIKLSDLSSGVYFVRLENDVNHQVVRLIKE